MTLSVESLANTLDHLNIPLHYSEVHGLCCGLLCALPSAAAKTRWFTELLDAGSLSADNVASKAAELKLLDEWFTETLTALNGSDLEFTPALPDDSTAASYRIRSLGDFCGGFTYGIGLALSQRGQKPLPEDTREIIEDFQAIDAVDADDPELALKTGAGQAIAAQANTAKANQNEADESAYFELLEYVRVGVLLVLEELRPVTPVTQEKPS